MHSRLMHPADQLVHVMNRIYAGGLTTTSGGNLSIMEPDGSLWITPEGVDKGTLHRGDIVCMRGDGSKSGHRDPSLDLDIHSKIYKSRKSINAILHAHSPALVAFSAIGQIPDINLIPNTCLTCGPVGMAGKKQKSEEDIGTVLAAEFAAGFKAVLLENHGVCVAAESLSEAYTIFETLEFAARIELTARNLGPLCVLSDEQINIARTKEHTRLSEFIPRHHSSEELALRRDMVRLVHRALDQQMFLSSQGTVSARLRDGSFLITPYGIDRRDIHEESLVLVNRGMKEAGKVTSRAVFLHELIYRNQRKVKAIISAQPPSIMPFTLTATRLKLDIIPENSVLPFELPLVEYGLNYLEPQKTAKLFDEKTPAVLLENDGIIITGNSLHQAFDRFEAADFAARAQLLIPYRERDQFKDNKKK